MRDAYYYNIMSPFIDLEEKCLRDLDINVDDVFCYSTTTHSAIHIGAICGARNIYLIGCDYKKFDNGAVHCNTSSETYSRQEWEVLEKHKKGDMFLKKELNNTLIKSHEKLSSDYETLESKLKDSNKKIELLNEKNARLKSLSNMSAWQFIKWKLKNKS